MNEFDPNLGIVTIDSFAGLIERVMTESVPCRLLTVVVRAETIFRRQGDETRAMRDEGCLSPVMMRAWPVEPILSVDAIAQAADDVTHDWSFLMVAVMPGRPGQAPADADCDAQLERMVKALSVGDGLEAFVFFDRYGTPVEVTPASR